MSYQNDKIPEELDNVTWPHFSENLLPLLENVVVYTFGWLARELSKNHSISLINKVQETL